MITVPFNYDKSGYDSISQYHSQYLGDNANTTNLVSKLPLNEYSSGIMINPKSFTLHVEYKIALLYIDEYYLKKCLIYNSVSMFLMIENLEGIEYSIVGKTFKVNREDVIQYYSDYYKIKDKDSFEEYLAGKLDDAAFINDMFDCLISLS